MSKRRDAGEIRRKKVLAFFRKVVRGVILNSAWLGESTDQKISLNVKKNIAMLVRTSQKVGMLTMSEKSLLSSPPWSRSVEDRKKLCRLLANLPCLQCIPPKMRARLVPCIKFMVLNPGRVIMKENDFPMTVYFIISGEVEMTQEVFDVVKQKTVVKSRAIFATGDTIGAIEMVENCLRRNTYVTLTQVELLSLFDTDFEPILGEYMAKQWGEKKKAIRALEYFNFLTEDQLISACTFGQLQQFDPLETIYYEDKGSISFVHFVVSGECEILQCLNMRVTQRGNVKSFELADLESSNVFRSVSKHKHPTRSEFDINDLVLDVDKNEEEEGEQAHRKKAVRKMDLKSIEINCGLRKSSVDKNKSVLYAGSNQMFVFGGAEDSFDYNSETHEDYISITDTSESSEENLTVRQPPTASAGQMPNDDVVNSETNSETESEIMTASTLEDVKKFMNRRQEKVTIRNESHFIDVGSLTFGGIFGLGEKLEHRVIMARTTVQCLMLPRFWLMEKQQNPGNIWQRRRFYLDCTIPSREVLFNDFLKTRKWEKFKHDFIQSNLNQNSISNHTMIDDIPIMCRIMESNAD